MKKRILSTDDDDDGGNGPVLNDGVLRFVAVRSHDRRSSVSPKYVVGPIFLGFLGKCKEKTGEL